MTHTLRIATRKSPLALWQAEHVKDALQTAHPDLPVELITMTTQGDQMLSSPLSKIGGKGLFVKELEQGMLDGAADIAVHSMKDVPVQLHDELSLPVIMERGNPFDALVSNRYKSVDELPANARVGTCSLRRQSQLLASHPKFRIHPLRGNVNSRLAKLDRNEFDAIILAAAGLIRLDMADRIAYEIPADISLPAVGQGAIGIECRSDDDETMALIANLHDVDTATRVAAERALNARLNGGCQVPIGGFANLDGDSLHLKAMVGAPDGSTLLYAEESGHRDDAEAIGIRAAESLLEQGAGPLLAAVGITPTE